MRAHIQLLSDFTEGLRHQEQFTDTRMLATLEQEGAGLFRLAENCLSREQRFNSARVTAPTTYEAGTANAVYWRPRPPRRIERREAFGIVEVQDMLVERSHGILCAWICFFLELYVGLFIS